MRLILQPMEQATLRVGGRVRVRCLGGTLWITGRAGGDRVLEAGESMELPGAQVHHLSSVRRRGGVDVEMSVLVPPRSRGLRGAVAALLHQLRQLL